MFDAGWGKEESARGIVVWFDWFTAYHYWMLIDRYTRLLNFFLVLDIIEIKC